MNKKANEVTHLIESLNPPLAQVIDRCRDIILSTPVELEETIKWNGPNYRYKQKDRLTLRIQDIKQVQLIFHRGAKVQTQPQTRLIEDEFNILIWKENDRAIISFKSMDDINKHYDQLKILINRWLMAN